MAGPDMTPKRQQGTRVRRKHSKTLSGCVSCKRRHMKCDETKPSCQRCRKSGLTCEGYHYPKPKIFELSKPPSTTVSPSPDPEQPSSLETPPTVLHDNLPPMILRDANISWRRALLEAFFAACIPDIHEWNSESIPDLTGPLPYTPWPSVTWQLAESDGQGLVAQALSCLTLVALGMKTKTCKMIGKARCQYDKVLCGLQAEMIKLHAIHDPEVREQHINLIASVGFCCSQFEYILGSWENGDQHIQGMISLWPPKQTHAMNDESQRMFGDAWLLCIACCVTKHQAAAYSPTEWIRGWTSSQDTAREPLRTLLAVGERVASILQDHDQRVMFGRLESMQDVQQALGSAVDDIDVFVKSQEVPSMAEWLDANSGTLHNPTLVSLKPLPAAVISGYASSFVLQSIGTAWRLARTQSGETFQASHASEMRLQRMCEDHLRKLCQLVQDLYDQRYKMVTVSTLLHLIDSARVGFATLWEFCGGSTNVAPPWYISIGNHVASTGYQNLKEPWQASQCIPDGCMDIPLPAGILLSTEISV
ncbi:hypothetical protein LTR86_006255 [Recurvomyces mirabilis]|nr:hypothetical protein LTR86_006255 [Recurvomyces mirabilis]